MEVEDCLDDIVLDEDSQTIEQIREALTSGNELNNEEVDFIADMAVSFIMNILEVFDEDNITIDEFEGEEGELILNVSGSDLAVLIGRHGRVLDALQVLVNSMVTSRLGVHYPIFVDVENYKQRHKEKVRAIARSAAKRCKEYGKPVRLKPMNAYDRRLVHMELVDDKLLSTESEGEDPSRCVVVSLVE